MFSKGTWTHVNSMDVFYDVLKVYDVHPNYIKVKYQCWNKGQSGRPWLLTTKTFRAKVMKKDRTKWRRYDP